MAGGRPKEPLILTDDEREQLERWSRRPKTSQRLALRSRVVLECAEGEDNIVVAETLAISKATVGKWRRRFLARRLDGSEGAEGFVHLQDGEVVAAHTDDAEERKEASDYAQRQQGSQGGSFGSLADKLREAMDKKKP